jgi:hypothetical protein
MVYLKNKPDFIQALKHFEKKKSTSRPVDRSRLAIGQKGLNHLKFFFIF